MAGGNHILSVLGGGSADFTADAGFGSPMPQLAGPAAITNEQGTYAPVAHVSFGVAGLFLLSLAALVFLNKAGFRFSVTVG